MSLTQRGEKGLEEMGGGARRGPRRRGRGLRSPRGRAPGLVRRARAGPGLAAKLPAPSSPQRAGSRLGPGGAARGWGEGSAGDLVCGLWSGGETRSPGRGRGRAPPRGAGRAPGASPRARAFTPLSHARQFVTEGSCRCPDRKAVSIFSAVTVILWEPGCCSEIR